MALNTKLVSVKIGFKERITSLMLIIGFDFFSFCLTGSIPSLSDILVHKEQTSKKIK